MHNYKVGDILVVKDDPQRRLQVVQIVDTDKFPIKTKELPYRGVRMDFEIEHADRVLTNIGNDLSKVLYE